MAGILFVSLVAATVLGLVVAHEQGPLRGLYAAAAYLCVAVAAAAIALYHRKP